jgi:hypothetical protein
MECPFIAPCDAESARINFLGDLAAVSEGAVTERLSFYDEKPLMSASLSQFEPPARRNTKCRYFQMFRTNCGPAPQTLGTDG